MNVSVRHNPNYKQQSTSDPSSFFIKQSFECKVPDIPQIMSSFLTCPYYSIRQLIVSFASNFPINEISEDPQSLLAQKYKTSPQAKQIDDVLLLNIHQYKQQKRRHQNLIECLDFFINQKDQLIAIQQQCAKQQQKINSLDHSKTIQNLEQQFLKLNSLNQNYKKAFKQLSNIVHYGQYLMSALHQIIKHINIRNVYPEMSLQQYVEKLNKSLQEIQLYIQITQKQKLRIRHKVKFGVPFQSDMANIKKNNISEIKQIYNFMYKLPPSIKSLLVKLQQTVPKLKQNYSKFLSVYRECQQVQKAKKNQSRYLTIIKEEGEKLSQHLKNKHGLMVKYKVSQGYQELINYVKSKAFIYNIYSKNFQEIQHAIKFVNQDYEVIFNQINDGNNKNAKDQLERQVVYFKNTSNEGYNTIILHYLGRLLEL